MHLSADAMVSSGLSKLGYEYVNIGKGRAASCVDFGFTNQPVPMLKY